MIAAVVNYGPDCISPFVLSMAALSLDFAGRNSVPKSTSMLSTESVMLPNKKLESFEQGSPALKLPGTKKAISKLGLNENLETMAKPKSVIPARRVIFPELHHENMFRSSSKQCCNPTSTLMRKTTSVDSNVSPGESSGSQFSRKSVVEESPTSVCAINTDLVPFVRSLGHVAEGTVRSDRSSLIIPPFKSKTVVSEILKQQAPSVPAVANPDYKRPLSLPSAYPWNRTMTPRSQGHPKVHSILRRKVDSVPSMVSMASMASSDGSLSNLERKIRFDPRIWVREFQRERDEQVHTWFTHSELDRFKRNAVERIHAYSQMVPTGTGLVVRKPICSKAFYSHPALVAHDEEDILAMHRLASTEIKNVLVVDPHDLCAKLFVKAFKKMLPHAKIVTAKSGNEAISRIEKGSTQTSFDVIVVEERLKLVQDRNDHQGSGSALIRLLKEVESKALFIGVSAHYTKDKQKLEESGAELTWPKPPPPSDCVMRNTILKKILFLRGKEQDALQYFQ